MDHASGSWRSSGWRPWLLTVYTTSHAQGGWQAGTAKIAITPRQPMWMSGYASRTKPSEGAVHDLWAKALAIKDPAGRTVLLDHP